MNTVKWGEKMKKILSTFIVFMILIFISLTRINAYGWGMTRNSDHAVPDVGFYKDEIADTNSFYVGPNEKKIYLTFDAGYDNGNLEKILDILDENKVPSTFFCTGDFIEREEDLILMIDQHGQKVGNHTYSHKDITKINDASLNEEITKTEELFHSITNKPMCKYFRPPEGEFNKTALNKVKDMGYYTFFWSIAYSDWDTKNQKGVDYTVNSVIDNLHNGAIILMHTVSDDNVKSLQTIITKARELGYEFEDLDYIVNAQ